MRRFKVFLDVISESLSPAQLSDRLEYMPSPSSHDKGESHPLGGTFSQTIWRLTSDGAGNAATLEEHCMFLRSRIPTELASRLVALRQDCAVELDIAVFFDSANCTLEVPDIALELARDCGARIIVSPNPTIDVG